MTLVNGYQGTAGEGLTAEQGDWTLRYFVYSAGTESAFSFSAGAETVKVEMLQTYDIDEIAVARPDQNPWLAPFNPYSPSEPRENEVPRSNGSDRLATSDVFIDNNGDLYPHSTQPLLIIELARRCRDLGADRAHPRLAREGDAEVRVHALPRREVGGLRVDDETVEIEDDCAHEPARARGGG